MRPRWKFAVPLAISFVVAALATAKVFPIGGFNWVVADLSLLISVFVGLLFLKEFSGGLNVSGVGRAARRLPPLYLVFGGILLIVSGFVWIYFAPHFLPNTEIGAALLFIPAFIVEGVGLLAIFRWIYLLIKRVVG